jgi:hypothetical protein
MEHPLQSPGAIMKRILLALMLVAGCVVGDVGTSGPGNGSSQGGGGSGPGSGSGTGSGSGNGSGSGSGQQATVDGGVGGGLPACTNAAYDPCTTNAQCTSGNCKLFAAQGFQVCTQTCTPGDPTTCPQQNGVAAQCNNMGICKPAAPNACMR